MVFIDETGIGTFLFREYGYAKRGEKVFEQVCGKKYRRVGIVAAQTGQKIVSPLQFEGTMDGQLFEAWFEEHLMKEIAPNSVIVMDNAAFHRKKQIASLAQDNGHRVIFLPPYSPDHNPIEHFWSWLKGKLKKLLPSFDNFDEALRYCFNCI